MRSLIESKTKKTTINTESKPVSLTMTPSLSRPHREVICLVYQDGSVTTVEPTEANV